MKAVAIQIVRQDNGYISASTQYPPREGEDWSRGNDLTDGTGSEVWQRLASFAMFMAANPTADPEAWNDYVKDAKPQ